MLIGKNNKP